MGLFTSYKNKTDEQLMVLIQGGDHRAFEKIYDRYAPKIKAFFYRMLWSNHEMAEDYLHDLFSRIIERPELYQEGRLVKPWLFQIASNMCKNAYRKRSFELEYLSQIKSNGIHHSAIERELDQEIMKERLDIALNCLSEGKRELFLLRYQTELSVRELAQIFEVSEGTIKSRLFHVRKALTEFVKEDKVASKYEK